MSSFSQLLKDTLFFHGVDDLADDDDDDVDDDQLLAAPQIAPLPIAMAGNYQHSAHQDTNRYLLLQLLQLLLHRREQSSTETILRAAQRPLMLPIPQTYTHRTHFRIVLQDLGADDEDGGLAAQCWLSGCVARAKTIPFLGLLLSFAGPR